MVVRSTADYSRLPYFDGTRDVNGDVAQISDEIVGQAFEDETALLRAGMHLHWALPDALTRGRQAAGGGNRAVFAAVPDRWLVRRTGGGLAPRAWVVESGYLHPDGTGSAAGVAVPFPKSAQSSRPFRYLGRAVPRELWQERDPNAEYVRQVTAVGYLLNAESGYSDPTFAALYPNCHSVFGFHDPQIGAAIPPGLRYELLGWYGDPAQDFLATVRAIADTTPRRPFADVLRERAAWTYPGEDAPTQMVCYAACGFTATTTPARLMPATLTVGNTATEALSVALALRIDPAHRVQVEDHLEAILLASRIEHRLVDVDAKFRELRHEKGFVARRGGRLWTIAPASAGPEPADADRGQAQATVPLPPGLASLLAALNEAQRVRDRAVAEAESQRRQLFADWYKYLLCAYPPEDTGDAYPDIDEVRAFVQRRTLPRTQQALAALQPGDTPEGRLATAYAAAKAAVASFNTTPQLRDAGLVYELSELEAPRYWEPTDPVVHLLWDDAKPTDRHGFDGVLACSVAPAAEVRDIQLRPEGLTALLARQDQASAAFRPSDGRPWNPFQLEWQVELLPLRARGNLYPEVDAYDPDFVTGGFALNPTEPDLVCTDPNPAVAGAAALYTGTTLLTGHAGGRMRDSLRDYLDKQILPEYFAAAGGPAPEDIGPVIGKVKAWYLAAHPAAGPDDQVFTAIRAYEELAGMDCLAQSLGGFNDALLMHRLVKQLPVGDPLAFPDEVAFGAAVAAAVGTSNRSAPQPLNDFSPIRSGTLRLARLRLVDTFGQTREVPTGRLVPAESLTVPGNTDLVALPPRLSQPSRVQFRWLAADRDGETSEHPDTTPVCGWFLPDHVDTSLMVYDNRGAPLGVIDARARWSGAPGGTGVARAADIGNVHLRETVTAILGGGAAYVAEFMAVLDSALTNIEPVAEHQVDLAVLVGRPIALVRAAFDLELLGLPAVHQGWNQFRQDMLRGTRDTDAFTRVRFPVRFGAHEQLDDGMIGYWPQGDPVLRSPQAAPGRHPLIRTCGNGPLTETHAVDDPPLVLRMLVDPRGKVHVTTGIQPVKSISIPPVHYAAAMGALEMTFPLAAVLAGADGLRLPLPVEPGYRWGWVSENAGAWREVGTAATIGRSVFAAALADRLWDQLTDPRIGWLRHVPADERLLAVAEDARVSARLDPPFRAMTDGVEAVLAPLGTTLLDRPAALARLAETVAGPAWTALRAAGWLLPPGPDGTAELVARDRRAQPVLAGVLAGAEAIVDAVLDLGEERIGPASPAAAFAAVQGLRGGWLKLRHEPTGT
ncbi:hypothetical protein ABT369_09975 [Dactylosporangium sp. NPDC000244]|uniref:hypothetical protein n=1 Tax=Dactylosporangium sp. NPDC000244 TaxID=3154365 RepID=UPI00332F7149